MANNFLPFCETDTGTNLLSQGEYAVDVQRDIGNQPGIARSKLVNKALRQATAIASQIAQFVENKTGDSVLDDGNMTTLLASITKAFNFEGAEAKTTTFTADLIKTVYFCSTAGGAYTATLPAASGNAGKVYVFIKTTSDTNALTIDGNSSETINGVTTIQISQQYQATVIVCDGTNWLIYASSNKKIERFRAYTGNGVGGTNTTCRRYATVQTNTTGYLLTYADSAPNAASWTCNVPCKVTINVNEQASGANNGNVGITLNSAGLTTNVSTLARSVVMSQATVVGAGATDGTFGTSATLTLVPGDVLRVQIGPGTLNSAAANALVDITAEALV